METGLAQARAGQSASVDEAFERNDLSFRTSDRCHWCGNPHPPSLAPLLRGAGERSETEGFFRTFLRVGKPHHRFAVPLPFQGRQGGRIATPLVCGIT